MLAIVLSAVIESGTLPPGDLVELMLKRIRKDTAASGPLTFLQERTEYKKDGSIKNSESRAVHGTGTGFVQRLTKKNRVAILDAPEEPSDTDMALLVTKYEFTPLVAVPTLVAGYDCWQVAFKPHPGLKDLSEIDAALNHIKGIAFVDVHNYLTRSIRATMTESFAQGPLSVAQVTALSVDVQQVEWKQNEWDAQRVGIQTTIVGRVLYKVLVFSSFLRIEYLNTAHAWKP